MLNSDSRKLMLSGWLKQNGTTAYNSPLKFQKFLLFYEAFSKVNGKSSDFRHLKGYQRGPVFSNVLGDYTHERSDFDIAAEKAYFSLSDKVDEEYAKRSNFIVSVLSETDLSSLTHELNIWKSKEPRIMRGERHVALSESDFNAEDAKLITLLEQMYPLSLINNSRIIDINNNYFVFNKNDASKLSEQHFDILGELSDKETLHNPVYVEIDEEGMLIVD